MKMEKNANDLEDGTDSPTVDGDRFGISSRLSEFPPPALRGYHGLRANAALTGDARELDRPLHSDVGLRHLARLLSDLSAWAKESHIDFERALVLAKWNRTDYYPTPDEVVILMEIGVLELARPPEIDLALDVAVDIVRDGVDRAVGLVMDTDNDRTPI